MRNNFFRLKRETDWIGMMFKFRTFLLMLVFLFCAVSCGVQEKSQEWMKPNGKIKVLSTIAMIDDMIKRIGGNYVDATTLIKGELDPHSYQLVKGDDEKLAFADIIFYNGLGLEHGPSLHHYLETNSKAIGLGDQLQREHPELILTYNGQLDPHIWMDVSLWGRTLIYIADALAKKDPSHSAFFYENATKLGKDLENLHEEIRSKMQEIPEQQRYLVTSHDAFNYFTRSYLAENKEIQDHSWQKRFAAPEGLAPESQLSVAEIQFIIDYLSMHQIHMLFPESNVSKDSIRKIVEAGTSKGLNLKIAGDFLYADAMGKAGSDGDTYMKMMTHNANTIAHYLWNNYP